MVVLPPHHQLQYEMNSGQRGVFRDSDLSPDRRGNAAQGYLELIERLIIHGPQDSVSSCTKICQQKKHSFIRALAHQATSGKGGVHPLANQTPKVMSVPCFSSDPFRNHSHFGRLTGAAQSTRSGSLFIPPGEFSPLDFYFRIHRCGLIYDLPYGIYTLR